MQGRRLGNSKNCMPQFNFFILILLLCPISTLQRKLCTGSSNEEKISGSTVEKMAYGQVSHDLAIGVPASLAWQLYGSLQLGNVLLKESSSTIQNIQVEKGDGDVGTVIKLTFPPGTPGFTTYKEMITKLDNDELVKETEVIEGGFLDLGFTLYRIHFHILKKAEDSCIVSSTIMYEIKDQAVANASFVHIESLMDIANVAKAYLIKNYTNALH